MAAATQSEPWQQADEIPAQFNACDFYIDRHLQQGRGDKIAIIDDNTSTSFAQLAANVSQCSGAMDDLGLRQEDRVAVLMLDSVHFYSVFWGAIKAGVVPVALNTLLVTENYQYILRDCRAQYLFVSAELLPVIEPILDTLPHLRGVITDADVSGRTAPVTFSQLQSLMQKAVPRSQSAPTQRDETAFWLYSSGSTGNPKGVLHRHSSLYMTGLNYGVRVLGITESDTVYSAAKLFFAYGLGNSMTFPLFVGATTTLIASRPTPQAVKNILITHNATLFFGVPTLFAAMLADPECVGMEDSVKLRLCVSAGEALPAEISKRWHERFSCETIDGVGSTEMLHIYLSNRPGDVRPGASGLPVPGYKLRLCDEKGGHVSSGEIGELVVRGESAASGYWNLRAKTVSTFRGEDTWTGDKYYQDADAYYIYCGRTDDMFKSGGNWVSPFEVESALIEHSAVLEAAVVPKQDDAGNDKPFAWVVLQQSHSASDELADELKTFVRERIELWKHPRWIEFVDDLPKTATGKIQRFKLRHE